MLGLSLTSPSSFEAGESSFSGPTVLEPSNQSWFSILSLGKSELKATKKHESSVISLETSVKPAMATVSSLAVTEVVGKGGQHSPSQIAQPSTMPTGPSVVAHASHELISAVGAPSGSIMLSEVSSTMVSSITMSKVMGTDGFGGLRSQNQSSTLPVKPVGVAQASCEPVLITTNPIVSVIVNLTSQVATEGGDVDFMGSEGSATVTNDSNIEGVHLLGPTIRELVGNLDKS